MNRLEVIISSTKLNFNNDLNDGLLYDLCRFLKEKENDIELIRTKSEHEFENLKRIISNKFFDKFCADFEHLIALGDSEALAIYLTMIEGPNGVGLSDSSLLVFKETQNKVNGYQGLINDRNKSGCYIATMVYGDYDHPQVVELRNFRDETLGKQRIGKKIILLYYKYSPKIVERLKDNKAINSIIRKTLDLLIKLLKNERSIH